MELPITYGDVPDDNILVCLEKHIKTVLEMQKHLKSLFSPVVLKQSY